MTNKNTYPRVFYFGMINTAKYARLCDENLHVGAGSSKMLSVIRALRSVGVKGWVISLPVLGATSRINFKKNLTLEDDGVPVLFLNAQRNRILRKFIGSISFLYISLKFIKSYDKVIIYNHALEYIPSLLFLYFKGVKVYQDIEDLPLKNDYSINGLINSIGFKFASIFTQKNKILVSNGIAKKLSLKNYFVIQGVVRKPLDINNNKWTKLLADKKCTVNIHYGGMHFTDTGVDLFCNAVKCISKKYPIESRPICFYLTGSGEIQKFYNLKNSVKNSNIKLVMAFDLNYKSFIEILQKCHASLSLKLPHSKLALTTFPSKTIEIASYSLALISTIVSDIPEIFDENNAYLLSNPSPECLMEVVCRCAEDVQELKKISFSGNALVQERFSTTSIGSSLSSFLGI